MSEKRLIEIASTISMLNGQLVILGYLSSLSESDMYLFFYKIFLIKSYLVCLLILTRSFISLK